MKTTQNLPSKALLAAAIAAALALAAGSASAQVRQIQMGNSMDANPGINSGGSNAPVPGYVPINGNDVMTGNVGGLGYFHGNSPISNPYTFRGNLPSSGINSFIRQSAPQPGVGGNAGTYYLPSSTVSTGQGSLYSAPTGAGFDTRMVPLSSYHPTVTSAQIGASNITGQAVNRMPTSAMPLDASVQGGVLNNPLFVLRTTEEMERQRLIEVARQKMMVKPGELPGSATQPVNPQMLQGTVQGTNDPRIGKQPDETRGGTTIDQSVDANVGSVYAKLAAELKQGAGMPGGGPDKNSNKNPTVGVNLINPSDIDPLTGRPRMQAASATSRPATQPAKTAKTISPKALENLTTSQLTAGGRIKPLKIAPPSSSGILPSAFDILMVRAEEAMKNGKYIDAQINYQTALANKPEDPLALVGLAHAEFAAGAYAPAAYDLKFVFTRKPELVSVHYDVTSFIPEERQKYLLEDLAKQTANKDTADMASFLYAYLCYQSGRTSSMEAELKRWGARDSKDPWQPVLTRAWIPEKK